MRNILMDVFYGYSLWRWHNSAENSCTGIWNNKFEILYLCDFITFQFKLNLFS